MVARPNEAAHSSAGEDKREAILAAALELFSARGFYGTAVPLIAEKANVGAGTVYRYFESKEELVNVLFQTWKSTLAERLFTDFPLGAPGRKQFHAFWQRMCTFAREEPKAWAFLELHHHAPYLDAKSRAIEEAILLPTRAMIEQLQSDMQLKQGAPELLGALAHGALVGMLKASELGLIKLTPEIIDAGEECAWQAIRA